MSQDQKFIDWMESSEADLRDRYIDGRIDDFMSWAYDLWLNMGPEDDPGKDR